MEKMPLQKKMDLLLSVLVICLGAYVMIQASTYPSPPTRDIGPGLLPQIIGFLFIVCGIVVLIGAIKKSDQATGTENEEAINFVRLFGIVILSAAYVFLLPKLGYLISTLVYLVSLLIFVTQDRTDRMALLKLIAIGVGATTIIYFVFGTILKVPLP